MELCTLVLDDEVARKLLWLSAVKGWSTESVVAWVLREALAEVDPDWRPTD